MAMALAGFALSFVLIFMRVPIAVALGVTGVIGFGMLTGWKQSFVMLGLTTREAAMSYSAAHFSKNGFAASSCETGPFCLPGGRLSLVTATYS